MNDGQSFPLAPSRVTRGQIILRMDKPSHISQPHKVIGKGLAANSLEQWFNIGTQANSYIRGAFNCGIYKNLVKIAG